MAVDFPIQWNAEVGGRIPKPLVWKFLGESRRDEAGQLVPEGYGFFTDEVGLFHRSQARMRIVVAPARTAKSFSTAYDIIPELMPEFRLDRKGQLRPVPPQKGRHTILAWIIGPDFKTNKEFEYLWIELVTRRAQTGISYTLGRHAYSPHQGNMLIELLWGKDEFGQMVKTVVEGKSATSPETLQGEEVDIWVQSEAAEHAANIYRRYGMTRAHRVVLPTTPKIKADWIKSLVDLAEVTRHLPTCGAVCSEDCPVIALGIESFTFTPSSNPNYDWDRYWDAHVISESTVAGRVLTPPRGHNCFDPSVDCQAMRDPAFAEQFGGRWTYEAERVLPFKWEPLGIGDWCHVLHEVPDWLFAARHFLAVDYGFTDPTAVLWMAQGSDGQLLLYREIYESGMDVEVLAKKVLETNRMFGERIEFYVGDPQKPEVAKVFSRHGMPVIERNKSATRDRAAGHARIVNALAPTMNGKPRLQVLSDRAGFGYGCPKTIQEFRLLKRKKTGDNQNEFSSAALSGADHSYDCLRYLLSSMPNAVPEETRIGREMRDLRRNAERFRQSQLHKGPLTGPAPRRIYAA